MEDDLPRVDPGNVAPWQQGWSCVRWHFEVTLARADGLPVAAQTCTSMGSLSQRTSARTRSFLTGPRGFHVPSLT